MSLSCGARLAKSMLIMFNLVFWLSGCALLFVGIYTLVAKSNQNLFVLFSIDQQYVFIQYLSYGLIGVGSLIFLVGFCGCCGAMQESKCMLVSYFIFLVLILAAELGVGIMAIYFRDSTLTKLEGKLTTKLLSEYGMHAQEEFTEAVNYAQTQFECCGINDFNDYEKSQWKIQKLSHDDNIPKTCCVLTNRNQTDAYKDPKPLDPVRCQEKNLKYANQQGCLPKLKQFIEEQSKVFAGIGIGIGCLEVFGMICALCLCKEI